MTDCSEIIESIVTLLRAMPELVEQMDGDVENIKAFHHRYPSETSWLRYLNEQNSPSIGVSHSSSFNLGSAGWQHEIVMGIRAEENLPSDPPASYSTILATIMNSIPTGVSEAFEYGEIHPDVHLIGINFNFLTDEEGLDYPQVALTFKERGVGG
jgi:hypothetical protein